MLDTNIGIYVEGSIRFTKELSIGGELITKDISFGLKTSFNVAEQLKRKYGMAMLSQMDDDEMIEYVELIQNFIVPTKMNSEQEVQDKEEF